MSIDPSRSTTGRIGPAVVAAFIATLLLSFGGRAIAQDEPFIVHDTKPIVMQGPYITSLSETGATIVWITDTSCHAKVVFGLQGEALNREADNAIHGLFRMRTVKPGAQRNDFTSLALGQDQIARVEATRNELRVAVVGKDGAVVETLTIKARR